MIRHHFTERLFLILILTATFVLSGMFVLTDDTMDALAQSYNMSSGTNETDSGSCNDDNQDVDLIYVENDRGTHDVVPDYGPPQPLN